MKGHGGGSRDGGRLLAAVVLLTAGFAMVAGGPLPLRANGGTLRVADAPVGSYRVSVYTDPTPPQPDSLDVSVLVLLPEDPKPVPDLEIEVRAVQERRPAGPDSARAIVTPATRDQADDPRYYAAKFAPGSEGPWQITVAVVGPLGDGEVSFTVNVREPGPLENPWLVMLLALIPLSAVAWWLMRGEEEEESDEVGGEGLETR